MAITLNDAKVNAQDDVDFAVIDDLQRRSWLFDQLTFDDCVNPAGGGSTLTYGYTRLTTAPSAAFRAINSEYTPGQAARERVTVDLKPLGGSFTIDRVLSNLGPAATNEVAFQMGELNKASVNEFQKQLINADKTVDVNGFDGLDKILSGSDTELSATAVQNWTSTTINTQALAMAAVDTLDEFVSLIEGGANAILGNTKSIARVRSLARWAGYYTREEDAFGRNVERYGSAILVDLGETNAGGPIIPIEARTVGTAQTGLTDLYAVRFGLDAFHAVATVGQLVKAYQPDFTTAGAVKKGEIEIGPVAPVLKSQRAAAVLRNVKVQ